MEQVAAIYHQEQYEQSEQLKLDVVERSTITSTSMITATAHRHETVGAARGSL